MIGMIAVISLVMMVLVSCMFADSVFHSGKFVLAMLAFLSKPYEGIINYFSGPSALSTKGDIF